MAAACYRFTILSAFRVIFTLCGSLACFSDVAGLITAFHPVFLWLLSGKRVCLSSRSAHPCGQLVGVVLTGAVLCEQQQVTVPSWVSFERTVAGFLVMLLFESLSCSSSLFLHQQNVTVELCGLGIVTVSTPSSISGTYRLYVQVRDGCLLTKMCLCCAYGWDFSLLWVLLQNRVSQAKVLAQECYQHLAF